MRALPEQWTIRLRDWKHNLSIKEKQHRFLKHRRFSEISTASYSGSPHLVQTPVVKSSSFPGPSIARKDMVLQNDVSTTEPLSRLESKNKENVLAPPNENVILSGRSATPEVEAFIHSAVDEALQNVDRTPIPGQSLRTIDGNVSGSLEGRANTNIVLEDLLNIEEWDQLRSLRIDQLQRRTTLRRQRGALRQKQKWRDHVEDMYTDYTLEIIPPALATDLKTRHMKLQAARTEYATILDEVVHEEDALHEVEFLMAGVEERLYKSLFGHLPESLISSTYLSRTSRFGGPTSPSPFLGLQAGVQQRFHPLKEKYDSRQGDLDLAIERLQILEQELAEAEQIPQVSSSPGLQDETELILASLPAQLASVRTEIQDIERDVEVLRLKCVAAGIDLDGGDDGSDDGSGFTRSVYDD